MPHSPSPSQKSPTDTELDSQWGVLVDSPDGHSDAETTRKHLPLHGSQEPGQTRGGDGEGGSGGGGDVLQTERSR